MKRLAAFTLITTTALAAAGFDARTASRPALLAAADEALRAGDGVRGLALLAVADERFPGDPDAANLRFGWYFRHEDYEQALAVTDEWLATHKGDESWLYARVGVLDELGRTTEADQLRRDLAAAGVTTHACLAEGDLYLKGAPPDYAKAAASYEKGLKDVTPAERVNYGAVLYNLACAYARLGIKDKALAVLGEALASKPALAVRADGDETLAVYRGDKLFDETVAAARARGAGLAAARVGEAAPDFTLMGNDGKKYSLASYRGQNVVLNVWATWCPPCRSEIPALAAFARAHRDDAVVLGLSVNSPIANLAGFAQEYEIAYPIVMDDGAAAARYIGPGGGIPQTFFIGKDAVIRAHLYGGASREDFDAAFASVETGDGH